MNISINWLIRRDLHEVLAIESACFEYPWTEDEFLTVLRRRNCIGMSARVGNTDTGPVIGFMIYELHPNALRLLSIAVDPDFQRLGVGRQMIERLQGKLSQQGRRVLSAIVRESNVAAQVFFGRCGMRVSRIHRGHYDDTTEDAYEFQYLHLENLSEDEQWTPARLGQPY